MLCSASSLDWELLDEMTSASLSVIHSMAGVGRVNVHKPSCKGITIEKTLVVEREGRSYSRDYSTDAAPYRIDGIVLYRRMYGPVGGFFFSQRNNLQ